MPLPPVGGHDSEGRSLRRMSRLHSGAHIQRRWRKLMCTPDNNIVSPWLSACLPEVKRHIKWHSSFSVSRRGSQLMWQTGRFPSSRMNQSRPNDIVVKEEERANLGCVGFFFHWTDPSIMICIYFWIINLNTKQIIDIMRTFSYTLNSNSD